MKLTEFFALIKEGICPGCGKKADYEGFNSVECSTKGCRNYKQKKEVEQSKFTSKNFKFGLQDSIMIGDLESIFLNGPLDWKDPSYNWVQTVKDLKRIYHDNMSHNRFKEVEQLLNSCEQRAAEFDNFVSGRSTFDPGKTSFRIYKQDLMKLNDFCT
jgi:hypothetical protein